jgi:hypothetical protein
MARTPSKQKKKEKASHSKELIDDLTIQPGDPVKKLSKDYSSDTDSSAKKDPSTPVHSSKEDALGFNDEAAILLAKFDKTKVFQMKHLFKQLQNGDSVYDRDIGEIARVMLSYGVCYKAQTLSGGPAIHDPRTIYGHIWDTFPKGEKDQLREFVLEYYFTLTHDERDAFKPFYDAAMVLAQAKSLNMLSQRRKLQQMDSAPIPMSGAKLHKDSTATDVAIFLDSVKRELAIRTNWTSLMKIKVATSSKSTKKFATKHLLDDFQTISEKSVMKFDFHTTSSKKDASIALYTALIGTMTNRFVGEFRLYNDKIVNQGPRLLFKILTQFSMQDSRVRADVQQEIITFAEVFKNTNWNVHLVCPILHERLLAYDNAGGESNVYYGQLHTALISMDHAALTQKIRDWEQNQTRKGGTKSILLLLQEMPRFIDTLIVERNWPYKKHHNDSRSFANHLPKEKEEPVPRKRKSPDTTDITAFMSAIKKVAKNEVSLQANNAKAPRAKSSGALPKANDPRDIYRFNKNRWGPSKQFKTEEDFKAFCYATHPDIDKSKSYTLEGNIWWWCAHCKRMGNHPTTKHISKEDRAAAAAGKHKAKKRKVGFLPPTTAAHRASVQEVEELEIAASRSGSYDAMEEDTEEIDYTQDLQSNASSDDDEN